MVVRLVAYDMSHLYGLCFSYALFIFCEVLGKELKVRQESCRIPIGYLGVLEEAIK